MSTELRRIYEMLGGLEKDAFAQEEGERMIAALQAAGVQMRMEVDVSIHALRLSWSTQQHGWYKDMVAISALDEPDVCRKRNDREVTVFIGRAEVLGRRAAAKEGK